MILIQETIIKPLLKIVSQCYYHSLRHKCWWNAPSLHCTSSCWFIKFWNEYCMQIDLQNSALINFYFYCSGFFVVHYLSVTEELQFQIFFQMYKNLPLMKLKISDILCGGVYGSSQKYRFFFLRNTQILTASLDFLDILLFFFK